MFEYAGELPPPESAQVPVVKGPGYTRIPNDLLDALCRTRIAGEERQVFDTILRKTFGFGKKNDAISLTQIEIATGLGRNAVCRGIKGLRDKNLIASSLKKGTRGATIYRINEVFSKWVIVPKKSSLKKESPVFDNKVVTFSGHTKETYQKIEREKAPLALKGNSCLFYSWWGYAYQLLHDKAYRYTSTDKDSAIELAELEPRLVHLIFRASSFLLSNHTYYKQARTITRFAEVWTDNQITEPPTHILQAKMLIPSDGDKFEPWLRSIGVIQ